MAELLIDVPAQETQPLRDLLGGILKELKARKAKEQPTATVEPAK